MLAENYGAGMHVVDYEKAPEQAIDLINCWVDKKTEGRIKDILSPNFRDLLKSNLNQKKRKSTENFV